MAFNTFIKKSSLKAVMATVLLFATSIVMAQSPATTTGTPALGTDDAAGNSMWMGVGYYVLLIVLGGIILGIVGKIFRVYDLTAQMQGKKSMNWNNIMGVCFAIFLVAGIYGSYWSFANQGAMILPEAASEHGKKWDSMFFVTFAITVVVFFVTQILLFGFSYLYRGSDKRKAYYYPHNNTIEKLWTVIPAIVLTILVITGFFTWKSIMNTVDAKGEPASINIDVTAHQFAWEIRYAGKDGKLGSKDYKLTSPTNKVGVDFKDKNSFDDLVADTIVLPVHKSIRFNIIAQDVIHSVYIPWFRVQLNAVPGLPTFFKFTPTITTAEMQRKLENPKFEYKLYCNKICGGNHFNMQKLVRVVSEAEYQEWLSHQKRYLNDQLKKELKMAETKQPQVGVQNRLALNN
jgi:cytochrome c oxidase subunit 2